MLLVIKSEQNLIQCSQKTLFPNLRLEAIHFTQLGWIWRMVAELALLIGRYQFALCHNDIALLTCIRGFGVQSVSGTLPGFNMLRRLQRKTPSLRDRAKSTRSTSGLVTLCVTGMTWLVINHCLACRHSKDSEVDATAISTETTSLRLLPMTFGIKKEPLFGTIT